ncbi:HK97 family phage prohead protease [Weissella diestrammenae]|uniref:HK97 family phage prohead protease n=2 Tax=Weissella diestrammenae TaxID=1162633 RepID=A0A7G9T7P6_9LACO|nr:HK97 family phage prohead protease [Weissella diestrammenae]QNN76121.1 HK97 family phage prohead protease [Weissella diestrammenae]
MMVKAVSPEERDAAFHFKGYLSTYGNADRDGDVINKGAFDDSIKKHSIVPMLFNHDRNKVIGKLELSSDDHGLKVEGTLNLNDPEANRVKELLDMGALDSMSVGMAIKGYDPIDAERPYGGWEIKQADVYEGSVVTIPANEMAVIEEVKSLDAEDRKELAALRLEKRKSEALARF